MRNVVYEERYTIDEKYKTPAYLDHFVGLAQLFGIAPGGKGVEKALPDSWYAFRLNTKYVPADIQISPVMNVLTQDTTQTQQVPATKPTQPLSSPSSLGPAPAEIPATPAPPPPGKGADAKGTDSPSASNGNGGISSKTVTLDIKTFDNEKKYHLDFSVAVPIRKISELNYVQTSNSLVPATVDKQKIFALFDYYFSAVDIKNTVLPKYPYVLTGVAIGNRPLQKALFGLGWGPLYANFYAAMLLNTQKVPLTWKCGDSVPSAVTGTLTNHTCPEFNFGLNLSVGAITDALKNKTNSSSGTSQSTSTSAAAGKK
jgi:hypothetical protein